MNLPVQQGLLKEGVSDERDQTKLANQMRALANQIINAFPQPITTTDATLTSVWTDVMPADSVGDLMLEATAILVSGAASVAGYRRRVVVKRVGTGAVTYLGDGTDVIGIDKESVAAWDVGFALDAANPGNIYATVTGAAATTIIWRVHVSGVVQPWA